jgi:hypothetical protein
MKFWHTSPEQPSPTSTDGALHFSLLNPFIHEVIGKMETIATMAELQEKLQILSRHQIDAFVREQYGMPLQPTYELMVRVGGRLGIQLFDQRYPSERDTLTVAESGVGVAQNAAESARYQGELRQVELFNHQVKDIISGGKWRESGILPSDSPEPGRHWLIGEKHFYTMPKSDLYAGDRAYVYFFQVAYTPSAEEAGWSMAQVQMAVASGTARGRLRVLMQPVFHDFSHEQLAHLHNAAARAPGTKLDLQPTEAELLAHISQVPSELSGIFGRDFFLHFFQLMAQSSTDNPYYQLLARQQRSEALFQELAPQRADGAEFFSLVLQYELQRLAAQPTTQTDLAARLKLALMMVMSPLIQAKPFDLAASWRAYQQRFPLRRWRLLPVTDKLPSLSSATRQELLHPEYIQQAQQVRIGERDKVANTTMLAKLNPFYLNQVVGNTMCTAMSFGDMTQRMNVFSQPFTQSVMGGLPVLETGQLRSLIGNNIEGWHLGTCIDPDCAVNRAAGRQIRQLVGPCSICASCQLRLEAQDLARFGQENVNQDPRQSKSRLKNLVEQQLEQFAQYFDIRLFLPSILAPTLLDPVSSMSMPVTCR